LSLFIQKEREKDDDSVFQESLMTPLFPLSSQSSVVRDTLSLLFSRLCEIREKERLIDRDPWMSLKEQEMESSSSSPIVVYHVFRVHIILFSRALSMFAYFLDD
jgi:hypothetical protein